MQKRQLSFFRTAPNVRFLAFHASFDPHRPPPLPDRPLPFDPWAPTVAVLREARDDLALVARLGASAAAKLRALKPPDPAPKPVDPVHKSAGSALKPSDPAPKPASFEPAHMPELQPPIKPALLEGVVGSSGGGRRDEGFRVPFAIDTLSALASLPNDAIAPTAR